MKPEAKISRQCLGGVVHEDMSTQSVHTQTRICASGQKKDAPSTQPVISRRVAVTHVSRDNNWPAAAVYSHSTLRQWRYNRCTQQRCIRCKANERKITLTEKNLSSSWQKAKLYKWFGLWQDCRQWRFWHKSPKRRLHGRPADLLPSGQKFYDQSMN